MLDFRETRGQQSTKCAAERSCTVEEPNSVQYLVPADRLFSVSNRDPNQNRHKTHLR